MLPKVIKKIIIPPIKCQGIKTKLVNFIAENIYWDGKGNWIEPFLGSGVMLFNIQPKKAILNDKNKYIIDFYRSIQMGEINYIMVKEFLEYNGEKLFSIGEDYYYEVRNRFNKEHSPLDLLFLNRAGFNGMMRFNSKGNYNIPFCKKPNRFRKAYITKIVNQVRNIQELVTNYDWEFMAKDWRDALKLAGRNDFIYADPPYTGRHTGYIDKWSEIETEELTKSLKTTKAGFALSMWKKNRYRENDYVKENWLDYKIITTEHFYHVGGKESNRNSVEECLILREPNYNNLNKPAHLDNKEQAFLF